MEDAYGGELEKQAYYLARIASLEIQIGIDPYPTLHSAILALDRAVKDKRGRFDDACFSIIRTLAELGEIEKIEEISRRRTNQYNERRLECYRAQALAQKGLSLVRRAEAMVKESAQ